MRVPVAPAAGALVGLLLFVAACSGDDASERTSEVEDTITSTSPTTSRDTGQPTLTGSAPPAELVCPSDGPLRNFVPASAFATERAGIAAYHYVADVLSAGQATLTLHGAQDEVLGVMEVRQLLGGDPEEDGVMAADFAAADGTLLHLRTRGRDLSAEGYTLVATLSDPDGDAWLEMEARFDTVRCWSVSDADGTPPCAGPAGREDATLALPGCGLVSDERIHAGAPAELRSLRWRAPRAAGGETAPGSLLRRADLALGELTLLEDDVLLDAATRTQWAAALGVEALVEGDAAQLLLTAWLDRAWWRTLEHHVAHCGVTLLETTEPEARNLRAKSRCPGDHSPERWGSPSQSRTSGVFGDPHFFSMDGLAWDLHATGEYTLLEAHAGDPFVLQGRFEPVLTVPVPECLGVSISTGAATLFDGRRITILRGPPWTVLVDGEPVEEEADLPTFSEGYEMLLANQNVILRWPGGEEVQFRAHNVILQVRVTLPTSRRGQVRGLLGSYDGQPGTDLVLPDGQVLAQPASFETIYEVLAPAWRLDAEISLFPHGAGEGPDDFYDPAYPEGPVRVADLPADRVADAEPVCRDQGIRDAHLLAACILDVVCMDDPAVARDIADAPIPVASLPPGHHDIVLQGDARLVTPPEALEPAVEAPPEGCGPWRPAGLMVYPELAGLALVDDLDVVLGAPGTLPADDDARTLAQDTRVDVWHVHRRIPAISGRVHNALLRFDRPVLGVLVDADALDDTDADLGAEGVDASAFATVGGLGDEPDQVTLEPDGRTLRITWTGARAHRLRILVEAP